MTGEMSVKEAIKHLHTWSTTMGSGQTTDEQHKEAKKIAIRHLEKDLAGAAVVPIIELKKLRREMDELIYETAESETILWTCESMIDALLEAYEKKP